MSTMDKNALLGFTRKPPLIVVFSVLYLLNPLGNFLMLVFGNEYPAFQVLLYLKFATITKPDPFIIGTLLLWASAIALAYGLYRVRLWAWYGFLGHSVLTLLTSVYKSGAGEFGMTSAFFVNALVLIPFAFFIRKEIRKPYFHPRLRWWEQHPRLKESVHVLLSWHEVVVEEKTFDLSPDGIFVQSTNLDDVAVGYFFNIRLLFDGDRDMSVQGVVVWINFESGRIPSGFGIKFLGISRSNRDFVGSYINARKDELGTTRAPD